MMYYCLSVSFRVMCYGFLSYLYLLTHSQNISEIRNEFLNIFLQTHFEFSKAVTLKKLYKSVKIESSCDSLVSGFVTVDSGIHGDFVLLKLSFLP